MNAQKAGFGLPGLALLLLIFFAFPWLSFSCVGQEVVSQNGFQVIAGSVSPGKDANPDAAKKKDLDEELKKEGDKESIAAWWLLLVPLGALGAGFAGFQFTRGNPSMARVALAGSAVAALVLSLALVIGLPLERRVSAMKEEMDAESKKDTMFKGMGQKMSGMMEVRRFNGPWLAAGTTWLMVGLSIYLLRASSNVRPAWTMNNDPPAPLPPPPAPLPPPGGP